MTSISVSIHFGMDEEEIRRRRSNRRRKRWWMWYIDQAKKGEVAMENEYEQTDKGKIKKNRIRRRKRGRDGGGGEGRDGGDIHTGAGGRK
jgi:hypothetical protein